MARDSFVFYESFFEAIEELSDEQQLEAYKAICKYAFRNEEPVVSGVSKAIFIIARPLLDAHVLRTARS